MTATLTDTAVQVMTRLGLVFSHRGTRAVCRTIDERDEMGHEAWSFDRGLACRRPLSLPDVEPADQLLPLDDGRIVVCRNRDRAHEVTVLEPCGGAVSEQVLTAVDSLGFRLLPWLGAGRLALAIQTDDARRSTIWAVATRPPYLERVTELAGVLWEGAWLDDALTVLGVNRMHQGQPAKAGGLDLRTGSWVPLFAVSATSNDRLLRANPRSGLVVVSTDAPGEERLGWAKLGAGDPVRFPEALHRPGCATRLLALDEDGERVLLHREDGARSRLEVYTPARDHLAHVEIPAGNIAGSAAWTGGRARFLFSTPSYPSGVATVDIDGTGGWSLAPEPPDVPRWAPAHLERLQGPQGTIEAVVYGGAGWRTSTRLVVALHGGPVDSWRFEFDPLFQHLAAAGVAVVAPNPRGSSGYGVAHARAIRGAWGGPDLDDVCFIARSLAAERQVLGLPPLTLLGISYGAFLALLAAAREPGLWERCVAIAPFLSGPRLYADGSAEVRGLIDRLGGYQEATDGLGPRDLLQLCGAITARLLIIHGDRDELIPVSHSRALRSRLLEHGRGERTDFDYVEVAGYGHALLSEGGADPLHQQIVRFLCPSRAHGRR